MWDGCPGQSLLGGGPGDRPGGTLEDVCPQSVRAENFRLQSGEEVHVWGHDWRTRGRGVWIRPLFAVRTRVTRAARGPKRTESMEKRREESGKRRRQGDTCREAREDKGAVFLRAETWSAASSFGW